MSDAHDANKPLQPWEREALAKILEASVVEQRRARRWGIFFKFLFFIYLVLISLTLIPSDFFSVTTHTSHTALIDINGIIMDDAENSAANIVKALTNAFEDKNTKGIILRIDSPGGSPVQAAYVFNAMQRLRKDHPQIKIYAVCTDLCASAAYYIAAGADEVYANQSSLVGSIGVLFDGFGFVDTLQKLGVERRLYTAGSNKGMLDPFSPEIPAQTAYLQTMLAEVHAQFIDAVKTGRGKKLKNDAQIFSGMIFTGIDAKNEGLVDDFKSPKEVARDVIKEDNVVEFTVHQDWLNQIASKFGSEFTQAVLGELALYTHPSLQ